MRDLLEKILNKDFDAANASLKEEIAVIAERKLGEVKKKVAAKISTTLPFDPDVKASRKRLKAVRKPIKADTKVVDEQRMMKDRKVITPTKEKLLQSVVKHRASHNPGKLD